MRMILRRMTGALLAVIGLCAFAPAAVAGERQSGLVEDIVQNSVLTIPSRGNFPLAKRISLGASKSMLVQFPFELKDVLVSDPDRVDAVVQASNRVFLIAKKVGQTNAFFFDTRGQQVLSLEILVGADLSALDDLLRRLVRGSNIRSELAGSAVVLVGTVRTPADAARATDIAGQFAAANRTISSTASATVAATGAQGQTASTGTKPAGLKNEQVINLLTVEGEEQVMLKVTVAEVQRSILKQMGVNLGAVIASGNFTTQLLTDNALPLTAAAGLGTLPIPALGTAGLVPGSPITCGTSGQLCN